jgi:hypothetical protein
MSLRVPIRSKSSGPHDVCVILGRLFAAEYHCPRHFGRNGGQSVAAERAVGHGLEAVHQGEGVHPVVLGFISMADQNQIAGHVTLNEAAGRSG